ncbi:MAG: hypothetical protein VX951_14800 [Planctomycetota bacterium]|nr:hypothetical protein [Planctomycetota bacterium]
MFKLTSCLVVVGLCAVPAAAQSFYIPSNTPAAGTCNVIPFGQSIGSPTWQNQRYQQMVLTTAMPNTVVGNICAIAFAPCGTGPRKFDEIEIKLGQTAASTLDPTFANNMVTNVQTVLKAKNYVWHNTANEWNRIGLDTSYLYLSTNGNLVIEVTVIGAGFSNPGAGFHRDTLQRLYAFGWVGPPPATGTVGNAALKIEIAFGMADLSTFGASCGPDLSLSGSSKLGDTFDVNLSGATATNVYFHVLALNRYTPGGIDMSIMGAPGCTLYQPVTFLLGGITDASGTAKESFTVPNQSALVCVRLYSQMFSSTTTNNFGLLGTNYGRILIGN